VQIPSRKDGHSPGSESLEESGQPLSLSVMTASRQAVSQSAEGNEPRKQENGKDDVVN